MAEAIVVDDFPHSRAGHCGSGALRDLLEFHGLSYFPEPLSEGMVFGLSGGLGFHFFELSELRPPIYLVGRTADLERDFCSNLGIGLDLRRSDEPDEGWRWLKEALDRGQPTMVWADIKHLDYLRVRMHNTMHDIVVTGYDEELGVAFVADNDRDDLETCSLESLARARNSRAFPGPNRNATWLMEFPDALPDPRAAVTKAVGSAVANMRGAGMPIGGTRGTSGLDGVAAFVASYTKWPELFGAELATALEGLRLFIVKAGTGGAMFRSLQAEFLDDAARLLGEADLLEAAAVYRALSDAWKGAAASVSANPPEAAHEAGGPHVDEVVALEAEGVRAMESCLEGAR